MKKLFVFTFLSMYAFLYSQERQVKNDTIQWSIRTCGNGNQDAKKDFEIGIYNAYSYGLTSYLDPISESGFHDFYVEYMRKKYSINLENRGCVTTVYTTCYSKAMDSLIIKKFGKNIFKRSRKEAKKQFLKNKLHTTLANYNCCFLQAETLFFH
jgi:hypothetical protein